MPSKVKDFNPLSADILNNSPASKVNYNPMIINQSNTLGTFNEKNKQVKSK